MGAVAGEVSAGSHLQARARGLRGNATGDECGTAQGEPRDEPGGDGERRLQREAPSDGRVGDGAPRWGAGLEPALSVLLREEGERRQQRKWPGADARDGGLTAGGEHDQ